MLSSALRADGRLLTPITVSDELQYLWNDKRFARVALELIYAQRRSAACEETSGAQLVDLLDAADYSDDEDDTVDLGAILDGADASVAEEYDDEPEFDYDTGQPRIRSALAREMLFRDPETGAGGFGHVGELVHTSAEHSFDRLASVMLGEKLDTYVSEGGRLVRKPTPWGKCVICLDCDFPLPLNWKWRQCEFGEPTSWYDDEWKFCHCNGCLGVALNRGRPAVRCTECARIETNRQRREHYKELLSNSQD